MDFVFGDPRGDRGRAMEAQPSASKVKRVKMTPASAEESKLKFRNYTPRDPELKKFILKKDNSEDSLIIKKQQLERFVTLSSGNSVRTSWAGLYLTTSDANAHSGAKEAQLGPQARCGTAVGEAREAHAARNLGACAGEAEERRCRRGRVGRLRS